ncbi:MAG: RagB/SusD family nutrient uptake outer membrane protein, partial [Bacteroidota bacterium]
MKKVWKIGMLSFMAALITISCTDLEIEETDSVFSPSGEFEGVEDVPGALTNLYNLLGRIGDQKNFNALNEVTTDELLVPTRGTDWGDNGIWRTLHA